MEFLRCGCWNKAADASNKASQLLTDVKHLFIPFDFSLIWVFLVGAVSGLVFKLVFNWMWRSFLCMLWYNRPEFDCCWCWSRTSVLTKISVCLLWSLPYLCGNKPSLIPVFHRKFFLYWNMAGMQITGFCMDEQNLLLLSKKVGVDLNSISYF